MHNKSMEQWKYIEGTNGKYQVSNYGRIKGENGLMSQWVNKSGYMVTHIPNYYGKSTLVHRLVAETFLDNPNDYPQINHANMIKCCKGLIKSIGGFKWKYAD